MASDWLAAVLPANQMPDLKIVVNEHEFQHGYLLVTQAPEGTFSLFYLWYQTSYSCVVMIYGAPMHCFKY